jgi:hypothetical protein
VPVLLNNKVAELVCSGVIPPCQVSCAKECRVDNNSVKNTIFFINISLNKKKAGQTVSLFCFVIINSLG